MIESHELLLGAVLSVVVPHYAALVISTVVSNFRVSLLILHNTLRVPFITMVMARVATACNAFAKL